jgi:SAM-dependent methyltransferase
VRPQGGCRSSTIIDAVLQPRHLRKVPYYARSAAALVRTVEGRALPRVLLRRPGPIALRNGLTLEVPSLLGLLVLEEIVCDDVYRVRELGEDTSLVVDVGAGIGDFALLVASRFPQATVIACEPNPRTFAVLARNVERNAAANVDARAVAVGTCDSYAPLDELVGGREADLVKIDCEGAELDVLESLGAQLRRVRRFAIEYHDHLAAAAGERLVQLLGDGGFQTSRVPDRYDRRIGYVYARRDG